MQLFVKKSRPISFKDSRLNGPLIRAQENLCLQFALFIGKQNAAVPILLHLTIKILKLATSNAAFEAKDMFHHSNPTPLICGFCDDNRNVFFSSLPYSTNGEYGILISPGCTCIS